MSTEIQLQPELTQRQDKAWSALDDPAIRRVLYGGAKGGGKSFFLCVWLFTFCWGIAAKAGLQPSSNPPHVAWFGRKQATDLTATTLQTWREVIPEEYYELKGGTEKDPKHILIAGRIAIDYGGLDKQANINKFNSAEYIAFAVDQAEEVTKDEISVLRGSLRMVLKDQNGHPVDIPFKELYTANPRQCWLKPDFITNCPANAKFVSALPSDNPHLPASYIQTLKDAFGHRKELLAAYMLGDWSSVEGANQVILGRWLDTAKGMPTLMGGRVISCDVARFGDDKTVIYVMDGSNIMERQEMGYSRTTDISDRLNEQSRRYGNCPIVVDEIGVGGGVIDELHKYGRRVIAFNSSEKSDEPEKYYNMRAQAWWELGQHLAKGEIGCMNMTDDLYDELITPIYDDRNGKILIESKDEIKKRLNRSPDDADCYIMGVWAVKRVQPTMQFNNYDGTPKVVRRNQGGAYNNNILQRGMRQ